MENNEDTVSEYLREPFGQDLVPPDDDDLVFQPFSMDVSKNRRVDTLLEARDGIYGYYAESKRYGTRSTVEALYSVAAIWYARRAKPPVGVGDISLEGGGDIHGHASHETGRDVDLRLIRNDGTSGPGTWRDKKYSRPLTQELIDLLYSNGVVQVKLLLFNDPKAIGAAWYQNHDNHIHVRFWFSDQKPGYPTVKLGSPLRAPVRELQRRIGYWQSSIGEIPLEVDGNYGELTDKAVRAFQAAKGLTKNGVTADDTWLATLDHLVPTGLPELGSTVGI